MIKPLVVVSSCLDYEKVRYNGQDAPSKIVTSLAPFVSTKRSVPKPQSVWECPGNQLE